MYLGGYFSGHWWIGEKLMRWRKDRRRKPLDEAAQLRTQRLMNALTTQSIASKRVAAYHAPITCYRETDSFLWRRLEWATFTEMNHRPIPAEALDALCAAVERYAALTRPIRRTSVYGLATEVRADPRLNPYNWPGCVHLVRDEDGKIAVKPWTK